MYFGTYFLKKKVTTSKGSPHLIWFWVVERRRFQKNENREKKYKKVPSWFSNMKHENSKKPGI
jgi:hypothetical protein